MFDMPPIKIWAGEKIHILFLIHGVPSGRTELNELDEYPDGHLYACQENAWMDSVTKWVNN
ncbi:hypothetical protein PHMEG_0008414 [Phytophthora megakarya]|uniref:Uncharacterized protein n=1 Tax=Phytophthora megakarya TaxID=4795 RepID=A0A225WKW4_9STRA|nr:hypothetical protein PHMEG_0008414 [Phytophthora megakarya]